LERFMITATEVKRLFVGIVILNSLMITKEDAS